MPAGGEGGGGTLALATRPVILLTAPMARPTPRHLLLATHRRRAPVGSTTKAASPPPSSQGWCTDASALILGVDV